MDRLGNGTNPRYAYRHPTTNESRSATFQSPKASSIRQKRTLKSDRGQPKALLALGGGHDEVCLPFMSNGYGEKNTGNLLGPVMFSPPEKKERNLMAAQSSESAHPKGLNSANQTLMDVVRFKPIRRIRECQTETEPAAVPLPRFAECNLPGSEHGFRLPPRASPCPAHSEHGKTWKIGFH